MADGEVRIKIVADSKDIDSIRKALEQFANSLKKTASESAQSLDKTSQSADKTGQAMDKMAEKADKAGKAVKKAGDDSKGLDKVSASADQASKGLDKAEKEANETGQALTNVGDKADQAGRKIKSAGDEGGKALKAVPDEARRGKEGLEQMGQGAERAGVSVRKLVEAFGAMKLISAVLSSVTQATGDAISRFDTLQRYPRVMQSMGYSAEQSSRSVRALAKGIEGLPTRLDSVVSTAQQIASMTGDIDRATKTTLALNNAFIASGSSAGDAERGLTQYIQMMSSGKVDMQSWKTLNETMAYGLQTVAKEFGFTGESAKTKLYGALRDGSITFSEFNAKLIEASERAGGFAEMALKSSDGIDTAMKNINSAIIKGVEGSIRALDELVQAMTGKNISQNLTDLKYIINGVFGAINSAIRGSIPFFKTVGVVVGVLLRALKPLAPALLGIATAFAVVKGQALVLGLFNSLSATLKISAISAKGFAINYAIANATMATGSGVLGLLAGGFTALKMAILGAWSALGPVALAIGAVVAVGKLLYDSFIKMTPEMQKMTDEAKKTAEASKQLGDTIASNQDSFQKAQESAKAQGESLADLGEKVIKLSEKENKSALEKKQLKDAVKDLNNQMEGLGLEYDKQTGQINMNAEALRGLIQVHNKEAERVAIQQRLVEITKEESQAQAQLTQNTEKLTTAQGALDKANWLAKWGMGDTKKAVEDLTTANQQLGDTQQRLATEREALNARQLELDQEMVASQQQANNSIITSYAQLNDEQQKVADNMTKQLENVKTHAQDFTNQIKTTIEGTTAEGKKYVKSTDEVFADMQNTLAHNTQAVDQWAQDMQRLSALGIDQGLLAKLQEAGPEAYAQIHALASQPDSAIQEFSNSYSNAGQTGKDAYLKSMNIKDGDLPNGLMNVVNKVSESMQNQMANAGFVERGKEIMNKVDEGVKAGQDTMKASVKEVVETGVTGGITDGAESVKTGAQEVTKQIGEGIKADDTSVKEAVKTTVDGVPQAIEEKAPDVKASGAKLTDSVAEGAGENAETKGQEIGSNVVSGVVSGINDSATTAGQASSDLAKTVDDSAKSALGIHSPSTVFRSHGENIDRGLADGINNSKGGVTSAITSVIDALNNTFKQGMNATNSIASAGVNQIVSTLGSGSGGAWSAGYWTGMGFAGGLSASAWSIYAVASAIASNVANTMRSALSIHSPSRVTRAIGQFTGEGLALGLEDMQGEVTKSATLLAQSALPRVNMAGTMALGGAGTAVSNAVYDNRQYNFNAGGAGGAGGRVSMEEQKRLFKEFTYYMRTEGARA